MERGLWRKPDRLFRVVAMPQLTEAWPLSAQADRPSAWPRAVASPPRSLPPAPLHAYLAWRGVPEGRGEAPLAAAGLWPPLNQLLTTAHSLSPDLRFAGPPSTPQ